MTYEGLGLGAAVTWQFVALVVSAAVLTMTTAPSELVGGFERLLRPFNRLGVPSHDIAIMVSVALRFVPTLLEEVERMKEAQVARGADFAGGGRHQAAQEDGHPRHPPHPLHLPPGR